MNRSYTLEELQANADKSWIPHPVLIEVGMPDRAKELRLRLGPPIPGSGPSVYIDGTLHDEAIGAEVGFSSRYLVVAAHRASDRGPTIYVNTDECKQGPYDAYDLVSNATYHHWAAPLDQRTYVRIPNPEHRRVLLKSVL
ncbi:MAG: hypothetical protein H0U53_08830 [Actinobacteria bacterium]|nr:hypothetical protein [Actinomycetota bacterium]